MRRPLAAAPMQPAPALERVDQAAGLRWCDVRCQFRASADRAQFVQLVGAGRKRERAALILCADDGGAQSRRFVIAVAPKNGSVVAPVLGLLLRTDEGDNKCFHVMQFCSEP